MRVEGGRGAGEDGGGEGEQARVEGGRGSRRGWRGGERRVSGLIYCMQRVATSSIGDYEVTNVSAQH